MANGITTVLTCMAIRITSFFTHMEWDNSVLTCTATGKISDTLYSEQVRHRYFHTIKILEIFEKISLFYFMNSDISDHYISDKIY